MSWCICENKVLLSTTNIDFYCIHSFRRKKRMGRGVDGDKLLRAFVRYARLLQKKF
ncbi:agip66 [Agrotis ipsilon multiple nucleopolyhedrovirus]|uniref:Uncharacterized protein n=1 Tax=Agrotis ipsilon multiple nucleopolyhedrovirus TaxID=208013 RepID=B6D5Y0_9ABAC|nr:agip66 [Agrotis ipsilon multiple nucleopolyhedrovirus]ACI28768.1 unknown [Agrotis ipsilon multiple nucleopolyhedrovirus]